MEFLENIKKIDGNELQKLLLSKMTHLDERVLNPPESIIEQILQIASMKIEVFNNAEIYNMITNWMRTSRNIASFRKNKLIDSRNSLSRVAGAITIELLKSKASWPLDLLNIYLDDALGCRQWVDAPELSYLTQNLLAWTKHFNFTRILSIPPHDSSFQDDSSGEEEVLDSSSSSLITVGKNATAPMTIPEVFDRYQGRHEEALNIIFRILATRSGLDLSTKVSIGNINDCTEIIRSSTPTTGALMSASSFLVNTMQSFCSLPPVRYLAAKCMSIWITNPALVEHVARILNDIGRGLLEAEGDLLESDLETIEALIKLRPSLKLSLAEVHRNILISVAGRCPNVTVLIIRLHLMENTLNRGNKPDSIKLLLNILLSIQDNEKLLIHVPPHRCPGTSRSHHEGNYEYVSMVLGKSIRMILLNDIYSTVDPSDFKTLLEDSLKVIRQLGIGSFCPLILLSQIFSTHMETETNSNIGQMSFSADAVRFLSDLSLSLQLLYTNSIVISEKNGREEKRQVPTVQTTPENSAVGGRGIAGGGSGGVGGRGSSITSSRGGGGRALGRGAGISTEGSSMFRSSAKVGGVVPGKGRGLSGRGQIEKVDSVNEILNGKEVEIEKENPQQIKDFYNTRAVIVRQLSLSWFSNYLKQLHGIFLNKLLSLNPTTNQSSTFSSPSSPVPVPAPAVGVGDFISLSPLDDSQPEESIAGNDNDNDDDDDDKGVVDKKEDVDVKENKENKEEEAEVERMTHNVNSTKTLENTTQSMNPRGKTEPTDKSLSTITMPYLIDRLQQFLCCLNLQLSTKISLDIDKMTPIIARDHHIFNNECLSSLLSSLSLLFELDQMIHRLHIQKIGKYPDYLTEMSTNKPSDLTFMGSYAHNLAAIEALTNLSSTSSSASSHHLQSPAYNSLPFLCSAVDLIEHCIQKALRTPYQETFGFHVDDISIIKKLFQLSHVKIFNSSYPLSLFQQTQTELQQQQDEHQQTQQQQQQQSLKSFGVFDNNETDLIQIQNCFSYKEVYWKVCLVCYVIGCCSPKAIGSYLWESIPAVQSLLLMSMSDRFYYPPSVAKSEQMIPTEEGEIDLDISSTSTYFPSYQLFSHQLLLQDSLNEAGEGQGEAGVAGVGDGGRKRGYISLLEMRNTALSLKEKLKSLYDFTQLERFLQQEEAILWEFIFQQKIPLKKNEIMKKRKELNDSEVVEAAYASSASSSSSAASVASSHDEEDSNLLNYKKNKQKKLKKTVKKRRKRLQLSSRMEMASEAAEERKIQPDTALPTRKSNRKHVAKFSIQELFKDEEDSSEPAVTSESEVEVEVEYGVDGGVDGCDGDDDLEEEGEGEGEGGRDSDEEFLTENQRKKRKKTQKTMKKRKYQKRKTRFGSYPPPPAPTLTPYAPPEYGQYVTFSGIPRRQDLLLLPLPILSHSPPEYVIKGMKNYHLKYKFGKILRLCDDPDFIASVTGGNRILHGGSSSVGHSGKSSVDNSSSRTHLQPYQQKITRENIFESIGWLVPAINAELSSNILSRIPLSACVHILFLLLHHLSSQCLDYLLYNHMNLFEILNIILNQHRETSVSDQNMEKMMTKFSKEQQDLVNSTEFSQDSLLCSQIIQKILPTFQLLVTNKQTENDQNSILISLLFILLQNNSKKLPLFHEHLSAESSSSPSVPPPGPPLAPLGPSLASPPAPLVVEGNMSQCGEMIGLIFQELFHEEDWLRRSLARIILQYLLQITSNETNYTQIFLLLMRPSCSSPYAELLIDELITQFCVVETDRSTIGLFFSFIDSHFPQHYQRLGTEWILESLSTLKLRASMILEGGGGGDSSDPLVHLIQAIFQSISHQSNFGSLALHSQHLEEEGYIWISQFSVSIKSQFLLLCGSILIQIYSNNQDLLDTSTDLISKYSFLDISFCQQIFGFYVSQWTNKTIPSLPTGFWNSLISISHPIFCNDLVNQLCDETLIHLLHKSFMDLSQNMLITIMNRFETEINLNSNSIFIRALVDQKETYRDIFSLLQFHNSFTSQWNNLKQIVDYHHEDLNSHSLDSEQMELSPMNDENNQLDASKSDNYQWFQTFPSRSGQNTHLTQRYQAVFGQEIDRLKIPEFAASLLSPSSGHFNETLYFSSVDLVVDWILWIQETSSFGITVEQISHTIIEVCLKLLSLPHSMDISEQLIHHFVHLLLRSFPQSLHLIWNYLFEKSHLFPSLNSLHHFTLVFLQIYLTVKSQSLRSLENFSLLSLSSSPSPSSPPLSLSLFENNISELLDTSFDQILSYVLFFSCQDQSTSCSSSYQRLIDSLIALASSEFLVAQRIIQIGVPLIFHFSTQNSFMREGQVTNGLVLRTLLYHAYLSFPDNAIEWIQTWIQTNPPLPTKWAKLLEKISKAKKTRLKKRSDIVQETLTLPDGRIWSHSIDSDVLLLFHLLMIEEGKSHLECLHCESFLSSSSEPFSSHHQHQHHHQQHIKKLFYQRNIQKFICHCSFDQQFLTILHLFDEQNPAIAVVGSQERNDLLSRCQEFLITLAQSHPAIFLRYQHVINFFLTKPFKFKNKTQHLISTMESNGNKQDEEDKSQAPTHIPPPLPVAIQSKDQKNTTMKNLSFTATGADINSSLWCCVLNAYHCCDPLILYLHYTTTQYGLAHVLNTFNTLVERRAAFHGLMHLSPPPGSELDTKLKSCLKFVSEENILKLIRKEKRLYRLLSVLETSTLELVKLDMYLLPFQSEEDDFL